MRFSERLWPTALMWALTLAGAGCVGLVFIYIGWPIALGVGLAAMLIASWALLRLAAPIEVGESHLRAGPARIETAYLADPRVVTAAERSQELGTGLDPRAFVLLRWWIPAMVKVRVCDSADPTTYWLISTRRPAELAAALRAATGTN